jgi:3-deoxy-D-manno-octulosonate 8-phosphate phosphatase (KDO 8-P phosphatase)
MNIKDKRQHLNDYIADKKFLNEQVLFMGDDIPDYLTMKSVGLACAPSDAMPEIRQVAHYITTCKGGEGCVREVIEKVLKLNGHWELETDIASK